MRLLALEVSTWTVAAIQTGDAIGGYSCPLTESLQQLGSNYDKSLDGLLSLFEKFSLHGPKMLNDQICHEVDKDAKIFEFIKGSLRVLWFYGSGNKIIICSHCFIKKGQKTPESEKAIAKRQKEKYLDLLKNNVTIAIVAEDGN